MDSISLQVQTVSPAPGGATQTVITDYTDVIQKAELTTNRFDSPAKLSFTCLEKSGIGIAEGSSVELSVDGVKMFKGYVFTAERNRDGEVAYVAYDQLRYLKANASYGFYGQTVGQIIQQIAGDLQVDTGAIADTGYAIPSLYEEDQSCLDIIQSAVQQTLLNTGNIYVFYDDGNGLALQQPADMMSDVLIGESSLLLDYTYKTDIDAQTYNSVKLARPNEETGHADVVIAQDYATIGQWGLLQLYQTVDGDANTAQMEAQAAASLKYYNRRLRTLSVSSLGVPGLRAGMMVLMKVPGLGDISLDQYVLLEKVSHTWQNDVHTMDFETMAI